MKLVDANLLLYAYNSTTSVHEQAKAWLENTLSSEEPVAFSWDTLLAFVRIATNSKLHASPLNVEDAIGVVEEWLACPNTVLIQPTLGHWTALAKLLRETNTTGSLVTDAHLAALAIEHDATLYSRDSDFGLFRRLRWINPLIG